MSIQYFAPKFSMFILFHLLIFFRWWISFHLQHFFTRFTLKICFHNLKSEWRLLYPDRSFVHRRSDQSFRICRRKLKTSKYIEFSEYQALLQVRSRSKKLFRFFLNYYIRDDTVFILAKRYANLSHLEYHSGEICRSIWSTTRELP